ncbi:MAG: UvrD-helicase domain-containing protein [Kiritimatiellia bacterium]
MSAFAPYLCISASAGSGKTFQLSRRVLRLLAGQQAPDEIAAYTFSRKAAGEIFDSIVEALCEAASSGEQAARTSEQMQFPHSREAFASDLRRWLQSLHRLRIGTLDSRISQMLSAVSVELGLPPEFSLMDTQSADYQRVQDQVLNRIFRSGSLTDELRESFLQLFSEATHGKSEKNFTRLIEQFLEEHRGTYLLFPEAGAWRGPRIENPPQELSESACAEHLEELREASAGMKVESKLIELAEACAHFRRSSTWSRDLPTNAFAQRLLSGEGPEVKDGRSLVDLGGPIWEALVPLLEHVRAVTLLQARQRTLALFGFLQIYQQVYQGQMLPGGQLSFEDACMLMADFDLLEPAELAYRLDGEISHWLLDEFQDTNRLQWQVLEPFISEILQDPQAGRSFFYVGDVKQAIYGWRGGDSELFGRILQEWPGIEHQSMSVSFRSAPAVLDLVNQVFSDIPPEEDISAEALQRWNAEFSPHRSHNPDLPGFAEVLQICDTDTDPDEVLLQMVRELPPGAETAILVRTNDHGREVAEKLRAGGFRVSQEGASPVRDDTAVEAILALLRHAAHPADSFSPGFLELLGLRVQPFELLKQIQQSGFSPLIREWIERLPLEENADFSRARLQRLLEVALNFDRLGDPSVDRFLHYVERTRLKEHEARGVIRVMTVHQSKGLGFDAVIVPVKPRSPFVRALGEELVASKDPDAPCVTLLPPKAVCGQIPEIKSLVDQHQADKTYESLCGLYVALTRAKQSLQVLLPVPPKSRGSMSSIENWLAERLGGDGTSFREVPAGTRCLNRWGSRDWADSLRKKTVTEERSAPFEVPAGRKILSRLEPSQESSQPQAVDRMFRFFEEDGRELGSRVHALLEKVSWVEEMDLEEFLLREKEDPDSEAAAHLRGAFALEVLRKPEGVTDLWREQRFETVLPEGWITGIFDRVVLFKNAAWIQDFKTNQHLHADTVKKYTAQMQLYRRVLADMLGMAEEKIRCQLLFTRYGKVVEV